MRVLSILAIVFGVCQAYNDFHNYDVVQVKLRNKDEERAIQWLIQSENLDVWRGLKKEMLYDILMEKEMAEDLRLKGFDVTTKIDGDQLTKLSNRRNIQPVHNVTYQTYNTFDEIMDYLDYMQGNHPDLVSISTLGQSFEGRDIKMMTFSNDVEGTGPIILLDATIHAREWIAPMVAMYIAHETLHDMDDGLLPFDAVTFAIVPVLNPDGYEYSWDTDRTWRKTRSDYGDSCIGTDGNRNFDFHWNEVGSSSNPCSQTYAGPSPASEPLTQYLSQYMNDNSERIMAYVTLHSYSQMMLYPYGYTTDPPSNFDELERVAEMATAALESVHGTVYTHGSVSDILYSNSGSSRDYAHGFVGIPYVYTIELRDTGEYAFYLPEDQIQPSCEETLELFRVVVEAVYNATITN